MTRSDFERLIAENKAKLAEIKTNGLNYMSKTGVKWSCEVIRDTIRRLQSQMKEAANG